MTYGQYARGYSLSFVEPYLLDYRVALGLDLYQRQQLANNYISYNTKTLGFSPRLGFSLREDLSLQLRYSIYEQEISLPSTWRTVTTIRRHAAAFIPIAGLCESERRLCRYRTAGSTVACPAYGATATANRRCQSARNWRAARP